MSVKLGAPWSGSSAWAEIDGSGGLHLELYDHSEEAASSLGGDVAWIWTVAAEHLPRVCALLKVPNAGAMLEAFPARFPTVHAVRDWLKEQGIPLTEQFDSQA